MRNRIGTTADGKATVRRVIEQIMGAGVGIGRQRGVILNLGLIEDIVFDYSIGRQPVLFAITEFKTSTDQGVIEKV